MKIMKYQNSPKFKIEVSTKPVDSTYEKYIQVTNFGEPIKATIITYPIMTVKLMD